MTKKNLPYSLMVLEQSCIKANRSIFQNHFVQKDQRPDNEELSFRPARVLMQDFTGVPAVVDLAAMRDAVISKSKSPDVINPQVPVDMVIDHSVVVDHFGNELAYQSNVELEVERNHERYEFLKWSQQAFSGLRVVPPGTGICHQVNVEYLAEVVCERDGQFVPDTVVGTDSHTTMVNGLGVLGWGVGGIEAEAAMLGQPISMNLPDVIGFYLEGKTQSGITSTDLVLTITQMLRKKGVVGQFVEFYGPGVQSLNVAERATIANMAPEYGATVGIFPVDEQTLSYLRLTGRSEAHIERVRDYLIKNNMWNKAQDAHVHYSDTLSLDMSSVKPSLAGPKRPQDRVDLGAVANVMAGLIEDRAALTEGPVKHGDIIIAAITSCTNTSNPSVLIAAGLLARKAGKLGLKVPSWVKTSLAPGSKVVTAYLDELGLTEDLNALGFYNVGYGCTTCIGNSGPIEASLAKYISENQVVTASVLSGNRNFEGRIHPNSEANWLASPPLVVAYALAGNALIDLEKEAIGVGANGNAVYLSDIWPSDNEISDMVRVVRKDMFLKEYNDVFSGTQAWQDIKIGDGKTYQWDKASTYIQCPNFFSERDSLKDVHKAAILVLLGDSVTTDHISPAGVIKPDSPAGFYLAEQGVDQKDFNSYGSRRGNFEVMVRGTFANIRIQNQMLPGVLGGYTKSFPQGHQLSIYDAALAYQKEGRDSVVIAGKEYGTGSSRDWAAKGTLLLGVKAVIAESFERIHRSNLIGMGVLPCEFINGQSSQSLELDGSESISVLGISQMTSPRQVLDLLIEKQDGSVIKANVLARVDTAIEMQYLEKGGILNYVMARLTH
ncbi:aconitate hydratase AcnA [Gammaproteobacteria bacterium]|nr:aconitate hydratase AcnA [Gammaproteobacteria bacterium]